MTQQYDPRDHNDEPDPQYIGYLRWAVAMQDNDREIILALFLVHDDAIWLANQFQTASGQKTRVFEADVRPLLFDEKR